MLAWKGRYPLRYGSRCEDRIPHRCGNQDHLHLYLRFRPSSLRLLPAGHEAGRHIGWTALLTFHLRFLLSSNSHIHGRLQGVTDDTCSNPFVGATTGPPTFASLVTASLAPSRVAISPVMSKASFPICRARAFSPSRTITARHAAHSKSSSIGPLGTMATPAIASSTSSGAIMPIPRPSASSTIPDIPSPARKPPASNANGAATRARSTTASSASTSATPASTLAFAP